MRRRPRHNNNEDVLEQTLWFPHLRPRVFQCSLVHGDTRQRLGTCHPVARLLELEDYVEKHIPPFTYAWLTERLEAEHAVLAIAFEPSRAGELLAGDSVCVTDERGSGHIAHGVIVDIFYRPRDNRTAWAEVDWTQGEEEFVEFFAVDSLGSGV
tara:strand:- start:1204 stop:1665 length:462 start_codon:yes stop_codon:yes gene_type:complete